MALDKTRPYSEHDGSMDKVVRYMQDNKHYRADETEILPEADTVKEKVKQTKAAKVVEPPVEPDANLA